MHPTTPLSPALSPPPPTNPRRKKQALLSLPPVRNPRIPRTMSDKAKREAQNMLYAKISPQTIADGVYLFGGQGNGVAFETAGGVVLIDAGPGGPVTRRMIDSLRTLTGSRLRALIFSHGHNGYNAGVPEWVAHNASRGEAPPETIAHRNILARQERYRRNLGLEIIFNQHQFGWPVEQGAQAMRSHAPTTLVDDRLTIEDPVRPIDIMWGPSETDDAVTVFLPKQRVLYGGAAVISGFPNIGTPLRTQRYTLRWAQTLRGLLALDAEILIPEFGPVVVGKDKIRDRLTKTVEALEWLWKETLDRMAKGLTDVEIIHDLPRPIPHAQEKYLTADYGDPDYVVRDVVREHSGWWMSRNPTDLHPAHPDEAAAAIFGAIDPAKVLARARELAASGKDQLALHVVDLVALAPGNDPLVEEARLFKADLCEKVAAKTSPFVSRSLYRSSARLLRAGFTRWSQAPDLDEAEAGIPGLAQCSAGGGRRGPGPRI
ncbi:beta-lactamase domain-containing protein [Hyaloraphidium curvatum]|nr:beta-lactamase domain-containing protein [Hyaloraphidium curvatum]